MENCIPKNWAYGKLSDLVLQPKSEIVDGPFGSNLKASEYASKGVPIIRLQNIDRNRFINKNIHYVSESKAGELARHSFSPGDVVITKLGDPLGKACLVPQGFGPGIIVADVVRTRLSHGLCSPNYLVYAINSGYVADQLLENVKGTTRPRVNLGHIRSLNIPLAPLNEQHRIVAKLEKLLAKVDECKTRLDKIPGILKHFRQAVLAAACSGELTADWRKSRQLTDRRWSASRLIDVVSKVQIGPFGSLLHKSDYVINGIPVINPKNIRKGVIVPLDAVTITEEKGSDLQRYLLKEGDVVVGRRGEMGRCAVVRKHQSGWVCGTGSLCISPGKTVFSGFIQIFMSSPQSIDYLERCSVGSTMTNLNQKIFDEMDIVVPPIEEQREIISRVNTLFKTADQIETRYQKANKHVNQLTQSILAKAFRGELVPQDPNDEPASELLRRIKAEREQSKKPKEAPKGKARKVLE